MDEQNSFTRSKEDETRELISSTFFRKMKFKHRFQATYELLDGKNNSYRNYVFDEFGRFSESKTEMLIDELISCLIDVRAFWEMRNNHLSHGKLIYENLSPKEHDFYKCYFYLLLGLALFSGQYGDSEGDNQHPGGTWGALCTVDTGYHSTNSLAELDRDIINCQSSLSHYYEYGILWRYPYDGIFDRLSAAYEFVTGRRFIDILSEKEKSSAHDLLSETEQRILDDPSYADEWIKDYEKKTRKERDELRRQMSQVPDAIYTQDEIDSMDEEFNMFVIGKLDADEDDKLEDWKTYFEDETRFVKSIKKIRKGMFEKGYHGKLEKEIPAVIEIFLSKHGISSWFDDDEFFRAYTYLNKVYHATKRLIGGK